MRLGMIDEVRTLPIAEVGRIQRVMAKGYEAGVPHRHIVERESEGWVGFVDFVEEPLQFCLR